MRFIPVYSPRLTADDARAVASAIGDGFVSSTAPVVARFEARWAALCNMSHAVAVANGTAALELAVAALRVGPGDQVLCPSLTIISCARAIVLAGAEPVLVDADPDTWCLDVADAARRVTPRTRAILGVHLFGNPYDHAAVAHLAREHGLSIIEDAAQAHGASVLVDGAAVPCGGLGDVACFSFFANKAITTGEGGMVLCREQKVAARVRDLSNLCHDAERRFLHRELGHNYRLSALQAALGLAQLDRLDDIVSAKHRLAEVYRERLSRIDEWAPQKVTKNAQPAHWMIAGVLDDVVEGDASDLAATLLRRGVDTRPFFVGLHEQPALRGLVDVESFPVTERLSRRGLYLPSGLDLDEDAVDYVVAALAASIRELGRRSRSLPSAVSKPTESESTVAEPFGALYAEAYDALYESKDYAGEVAVVRTCFERFAGRPVRRVLDLGCGTGRHSLELKKNGLDVVGVDRSEDMLAIARERVPGARFVQGDIGQVNLGETFDAVLMMFAVLSYRTTVDDLLSALSVVRRHLAPGGLFVADVWFGASAERGAQRTTRSATRGNVEWRREGVLLRDPHEQRVEVRYTLTRKEGAEELVVEESHTLHYFHRFELELAMKQSGMSLLRVGTYEDLEHAPGRDEPSALVVGRAS